jgi:hypothetical protein
MTALSTLARLLGLPVRLAEDALHSERAARLALSRRSLFLGAGAMATGSVFSFAPTRRDYAALRVFYNGKPLTQLTSIQVITDRRHGFAAQVEFSSVYEPQHCGDQTLPLNRLVTLRVESGASAWETNGRVCSVHTDKSFTRVDETVGFWGTPFKEVS